MRRGLKLSPHFVAWEFIDRRAGRMPPDRSLDALRRLCGGGLEHLRAEFGPVTITSGFRTPTTNRVVGGAPKSRHLYLTFPGEVAADVVCKRGNPVQWFQHLDQSWGGGLGLYDSHIHLDVRPYRARW